MSIGGSMARRWFLALVALALLACAQGCGESVRPVATPLSATVSVEAPSPTMPPLPMAVPVDASTLAPSSTATPLPALMPTVVPLAASARRVPLVPPAGLEPTRPAPEAGALSTELRGQHTNTVALFAHGNKSTPRGGRLASFNSLRRGV